MPTIKARPADFAMWLGARLLAEAKLDQPADAQLGDTPARVRPSLTSALRYSNVMRQRAGARS
jgi:hypothetical protein